MTKKAGTPLPSFLDQMEDASENCKIDESSLIQMAIYGLQALGLQPVLATTKAGNPTPGFLASREGLAKMLMLLDFEAWQGESFVEFKVTELATAGQKTVSLPADTVPELVPTRWMRMVDLALYSAGLRSAQGPFSYEHIDRKPIHVNTKGVAYFLKCARFESWSEPGWQKNASVTAMKELINSA
jgi:hypothetical protein